MGFMIIFVAFGFFTANLQEAKEICYPAPIIKECYIQAIDPVQPVDYKEMNK